jgi:hypothetical protein
MSDEPLPMPDDAGPPADPFEAELVAYLDGELDPTAARQVEARLATDPDARAKAAALKKTFDLLDYLPKPEASPNFTTRTLDKLPAVKSGSATPAPVAHAPGSPNSVSSSVPVALTTGAITPPPAPPPPRRWLWAAGVLVAVAGFAAAGYFGAAALRPHLYPAPAPREPAAEELPLSDHRLVENLPLYSAADDLEFVQKLADPEFFGDEPSVAFDARPKVPAVEHDKPSGAAFEALAKAFKALPPARQQAIRELDRQLHAQDAATRDRLVRVLEVYAIWLGRLPDPERAGVLAAPTPARRLDEIRSIRERQWLDALPAAQKAKLGGLGAADKAALIGEWKKAEAERREEWALVRKHADAIVANLAPWPFDTEAMRKSVPEYMRVTFKTDDPKKCRLSANELDRYNLALAAAEKGGGWAWWAYGREAYNLARKYEHSLLPEPAKPEMMYLDFGDLPRIFEKLVERPGLKKKLAPHVGRWPDFPLELHDELRMGKFGVGPLPPLGPARPSDFKEPVKTFWEKELSPKLTQQERGLLRMFENRWPEYPREFLRLARQHDLSVPGVTLPGSPRRWSETYGGRGFGPGPGRP